MSKLYLSSVIDKSLKKFQVSLALAEHFSQFLQNNPLLQEQAIYLLQEKDKKLQEVIEDLYGVPILKQSSWRHEKDLALEKSKDIEKLVIHLQGSEKLSRGKSKLFQDCKKTQGLNTAPMTVGMYYIVFKIEPFIDTDLQQKFRWDFFQAKFRKKGWGPEKPLQQFQENLLGSQYLAGEVVKDYLENHPIIKERNYPNSKELPPKMILNGAETHYFFSILYGYPLLYWGGKIFKRHTNFVSWKLRFMELKNHKLVYICFYFSDSKDVFDFDAYREKTYIIGGAKQAILVENNYWQVENNILSDAMMHEAVRGVLVAHQEWESFFKEWQDTFDIPIESAEAEENLSNNYVVRDLKDWFFWLKLNENNEQPVFQKNAKIPKFYLSTDFKRFHQDTIGLKVEDFEDYQSCLKNPDQCVSTAKLFDYLKYILDKPQKNGFFTIHKVLAADILLLAKHYPYIYNHKKEPLFEGTKTLHFAITVEKDPDSLSQYFFKGRFYEKQLVANQEKLVLFPTETQPANILGVVPSYLIYKGKAFLIGNFLSDNFMKDYQATILAKKEDISDFYCDVYPLLKHQNFQLFDPDKLLDDFAIFYYELSGRMEIVEDKGILIGKLSADMKTELGDFNYPIYEEGNTFQKEINGRIFSVTRNKGLEKELFFTVRNHGWVSENIVKQEKLMFFMEKNSIVDFLFHILPKQDENPLIKYYADKNFKRWDVTDITSRITSNIKKNKKNDWFEFNLDIEGYNIDIGKIISIWKKGGNYMDMGKEKGVIKIDKKWMDNYVPILNHLLQDNLENNKGQKKLVVKNYHLGLLEDLTNWKSNSKKRSAHILKIVPHEIPSTIKADLRDYQKEGVSWLCFLRKYNFGGILADDMGLGKTLQAITFFEIIRITSKNKKRKPHLVICPTSIISNWYDEIQKFCPTLQVVVYYGYGRKKLNDQLKTCDLIITTYSLLQKDPNFFRKIKYDVILLDEAQNIKNSNTKTSKEICSLHGQQKVSLTGTPIENNVSELWSQFYFLMPELLGSFKNFQQHYIKPSQNENAGYDFSLLRKQTKPFILRRIKKNVAASLPPKTEQILYCEMLPKQRKLYNTILAIEKQKLLDKIENKKPTNEIRICFFDALLKLRQICCDPRLSNLVESDPPASAKLEFFLSHVEEIVAEGHRILVFSQFVKMLNLMHQSLSARNIHFLQLDGSTKKRPEVIKQFQNNSDYPVFLISLKAGGVGLNLTAADYVIHYDPWWNPAVVDQASDRVYRIGQDKHVFIYRLITKDSIEEKILNMQEKKKSLSGDIINIFSNFDNMLETNSIHELFS